MDREFWKTTIRQALLCTAICALMSLAEVGPEHFLEWKTLASIITGTLVVTAALGFERYSRSMPPNATPEARDDHEEDPQEKASDRLD